MCGIVGYIGCKNATPILVDALKKLEYRGYDSAGIAVLSGDELIVKKTKGALKFLVERIIDDIIKESTAKEPAAAEKENEAFFAEAVEKTAAVLPGTVGIGHTRWATHGEPSDTNAHPHINESGSIAVVHNGIIENHAKLRSWLQSQGIVFRSQTDTEVVAHLTNYFYEKSKNIFTAVQQTLQKLEGSYALAVICRDFPDRIVVARKDCPLVVGLGKGENFIASDVPAIIERTRDVYFLEQKEKGAQIGMGQFVPQCGLLFGLVLRNILVQDYRPGINLRGCRNARLQINNVCHTITEKIFRKYAFFREYAVF